MSVSTRNHYLQFTRKDRRGTLFLIICIVFICAVPFVLPLFAKKEIIDTTVFEQQLASLQNTQQLKKAKNESASYDGYNNRPYDEPSYERRDNNAVKGILFYFDPNSLDEAGWKKLGLRDKTIATIINYRNKGGKFRHAEDIKRIWGLRPQDAERLIPYVQIAVAENESTAKNYSNEFAAKPSKPRTYAMVDINSADTAAWIALPGIGSKLSQRIIGFRDKLGGFYSTEQVAETFGLPDSTYQKIKPYLQLSGNVKKININSAGINELKQHPYIKYNMANAIIQYRNQHGNYKAVSDIKNIMIVEEVFYNKAAPYLSVE